MGQWGCGLYSGYFALDLRSTIAALVRLPFSPDRIADILCESKPSAANDATDEDHITFWLVIAEPVRQTWLRLPAGTRQGACDYRRRARRSSNAATRNERFGPRKKTQNTAEHPGAY